MQVLLVGLGGAIGSVLRFLSSNAVSALLHGSFPFGTMIVNLIGCVVIGFLSQLADLRSVFTPASRAFIFTGCLGGFTTFSSFENESANLWRNGAAGQAFANLAIQVLAGLAAVFAGRLLARQLLA